MSNFNSFAAKKRPGQACLPWPKSRYEELVVVKFRLAGEVFQPGFEICCWEGLC